MPSEMSSASSLLLPFLNHDIMIHIFTLNTQRDRDVLARLQLSPLETTRISSHVCRSWRQLILQSPVIWGNIIDLGKLGDGSEQWFEEVMKRTGKVALSIYGSVEDGYTIKMLISLLEENWDRVNCLDVDVVVVTRDNDLDPFYNIFWKRRAPILEEFVVRFSCHVSPSKRKWKDLKLFNGSAPLLRRIHSPLFYFDQHTPWISQLVDMTLSDPLKICDALTVLANTPLLETLVVEWTVDNDDSAKSWNQKIHLPNLRQIKISSNTAGSLFYLSHIVPRSDCALRLFIDNNSIDIQNSKKDDLERLSKIISAYVERYVSAHCPQRLDIDIEEHGGRFDIHEKWDEADDIYRTPSFQVSINSDFDPPVIDILLSTLFPTTFHNVHKFNFTVSQFWFPTTDAIIHIIRSLTAVKQMTLTPWAMHGLNDLPDFATLLPDLAEVTIEYQPYVDNLDDILLLFLIQRREAGKSLQTLYKPDNSHPRGAKHWVFLKQFEGLRVISTGHGGDDYSDASDSDESGVDDSDDSNDDDGGDDSEYDGDDLDEEDDYRHDSEYDDDDEQYEDKDE